MTPTRGLFYPGVELTSIARAIPVSAPASWYNPPMRPTQTLPPGYTPCFTLDLSRNMRLVLLLNLVAILLFGVFGWLFFSLAAAILPPDRLASGLKATWITLLACLLAYGLMLVLHELIHGAFFWLFSGRRPHFGFKGAYAYAAAPDWYFPRRQYLVVGISPLLTLSLLGVALLPILPAVALLPWLVALAGNAAGAIGDALIVGWLLFQPDPLLIQDHGDAVTAYREE